MKCKVKWNQAYCPSKTEHCKDKPHCGCCCTIRWVEKAYDGDIIGYEIDDDGYGVNVTLQITKRKKLTLYALYTACCDDNDGLVCSDGDMEITWLEIDGKRYDMFCE